MQKNKLFHILSYIPLLFLLSLFIPDKNSPAVRFHCGQGMMLTLFFIVCSILTRVFDLTLGWLPLLGHILVSVFSAVVGVASLALMVVGILNAAHDKEKPLPFIGKYAFYR